MPKRTSHLCPNATQYKARLEARRHEFRRRVLPALLVLLRERAERSAAPLTGQVLGHLLTSATASAGIVAARLDQQTERDWPDAASLTDHLYHQILAQRRRVCGPTPNRSPHDGYALAQVIDAAERLLRDSDAAS